MPTQNDAPNDFYIVGIGASAGGLEALEAFFSNCPQNTGIAFVIVQHLSPDYKSMMPSLLARCTKMPIKVADDTDMIQPDHIYLIPGNKNLIVKHGKLELIDRANANQINLPIDLFFASLANEKKENAIGIILSGTGSDGTRGGKVIKEAGGTLFVQDPETIRFDGMPLSVIKSGIADYVMTVSDIPHELLNFINFPTVRANWGMQNFIEDIDAINRILQIIKLNTGYNFLSYRRQTLVRRIIKRIKINKLKSLEEYITLIESDIEEQKIAANEFLIGVTKFFRNPVAFKMLEKIGISRIVQEAYKKQEDIKIWSVSCSSGEEAYSLAILIEEMQEKMGIGVSYKVFATDVNPRAIEKASKGEYKLDIAADIPPRLLNKYFTKNKREYQIKPTIRKNIIFSKHDILQNPPFSRMDLVSCRNMLIYLNPSAQKRVLTSLHFSLKKNGILFLGQSESLGPLKSSFEYIDRKSKIYKNIDPLNRVFNGKTDIENYSFTPHYPSKTPTKKEKFGYFIGQDLISAVNAICIFVDEKLDIVYAKGPLNKYFALPEDEYSNNILSVLPVTLNIPISTSIRQIKKEINEKMVVTKEVTHIKDKERIKLQLRVQKISSLPSKMFLITILEISKTILKIEEQSETISVQEVKKYQEEIKELRQALIDAKENLQSTVEELETTSEEIQSTNEELIASNEELQSTNEELQSVNEELHTVNAELQEKNLELLNVNSDMENLINSTDIGTIFLDKDFKIRRFTPAITHQLHLQQTDIGRPVEDFFWPNLNPRQDAELVLQTLQPLRKEFQNKVGVWYLEQIQPYRTQRGHIEGVVINFINIDTLKKVIQDNQKLEQFAYISSHDLKEPLNTIISALDLMKLEVQSTEIEEIIAPIEESTKRMTNLIEDLLSYSLFNKKAINLQKVNLNELLEDVYKDMKASLNQRHVQLLAEPLPTVVIDRTLIKQVFQNIIGNGIKYNHKKQPIIRITAQENSDEYIISISDNGIGIEEKNYFKIFDIFKTLHNHGQYAGTGIGLANCKSIIQSHKGRIWVESTFTKGSNFYFTLPKNISDNGFES